MQIKGKFFHLDETCPIFKYLKEGEACFFKKTCDALCELNDGTAEYKTMKKDLDFRVFPEAWLEKEKETYVQAARLISQLEQRSMLLEAKRLKQAYGFDVAKRIKLPG
jgi:predicted metal-binding transcription factor (methanogenesis marker protein 9)